MCPATSTSPPPPTTGSAGPRRTNDAPVRSPTTSTTSSGSTPQDRTAMCRKQDNEGHDGSFTRLGRTCTSPTDALGDLPVHVLSMNWPSECRMLACVASASVRVAIAGRGRGRGHGGDQSSIGFGREASACRSAGPGIATCRKWVDQPGWSSRVRRLPVAPGHRLLSRPTADSGARIALSIQLALVFVRSIPWLASLGNVFVRFIMPTQMPHTDADARCRCRSRSVAAALRSSDGWPSRQTTGTVRSLTRSSIGSVRRRAPSRGCGHARGGRTDSESLRCAERKGCAVP